MEVASQGFRDAKTIFSICQCKSTRHFARRTRPQPLKRSSPYQPSPELLAQPQTETGLENENLLTEIPSGFKVDYQAEQGNQTITEMVAEGESVEDWTTMVTVQVYLGETNTTPAEAQNTLTQSWFNACQDSESYPVADGTENGYSFILWQLYCPLNPSTQTVEYTYMKAIQGNDSFYLIQVAFRHAPSNEEITKWMQYLKDVQVCDSRTRCAECHPATTGPMKLDVQFPEKVEADFFHRGDWVSRHQIEASADPASCRRCHGSGYCRSCHELNSVAPGVPGAGAPHPLPYANHGDQARRNIVSCAGCHDQGASSSCVLCLSSGGVNPHPPGFSKRFDRDDQSKGVCRVCHQ